MSVAISRRSENDNGGQSMDFYLSDTRYREAAKCFLKQALANPESRAPQVFARDKLRSYPAAIGKQKAKL
jgi:transposase-like protein